MPVEIILIYLAMGVFAGVVAAMFGVGGGFAVAPILLIALTIQDIGGEQRMHLTIGTTQAVIFVTASFTAVLRW
ncbi:MAG: sulfite exporter TauE/SafE family protein, partial [Alphaproteobacteria bacterium]